MEIELVWPKNRVVPVPLINGLHLHRHLSGFLVTRYYEPKQIRDTMPTVTGGSLRQIAYDLKAFLEALAHNGSDYTEVEYEIIEKILEAQLGMANPATYNIRHARVRDFYEYLRKQAVRIKARFPARTVQKIYQNRNDNFLSHTSHSPSKTYEKDDGHKRTTLKEDFKDEVISIKMYGSLYQALKKIDVVYAVIAQVMMQTFLRIADICELPLHSNKYNRYIPLWPEFERSGEDLLRYRCLTKGMKQVTIDIYPVTLKAIYEDYVQPCYQDRKELFESVYLKRRLCPD